MKFCEAKFQSKKITDHIYIEEDELLYSDWFENEYPNHPYNYANYDENNLVISSTSLTLNLDGETLAYVTSAKKPLLEDKYGYTKFDTFLEVWDFGSSIDDRTLLFELLRSFVEYARYMGVKFVRIEVNDDFPEFFELISWDTDTVIEGECYIIDVENPIEYEDFAHWREYEGDALDVHGIYSLTSLGFEIGKRFCTFSSPKGTVTVDRQSKKISFPDFVKLPEGVELCLDDSTYSIVHYVTELFKKGVDKNLKLKIKIPGVPYECAALGEDTVVMFDGDLDKFKLFDLLYTVKNNSKFENLILHKAEYEKKYFHHNSRFLYESKIDEGLDTLGLCLDSPCKIYPSYSARQANLGFNSALDDIRTFGIMMSGSDAPFSKITVSFRDGVIALCSSESKEAVKLKADTKPFISVLKWAHFSNWKSEYSGEKYDIRWVAILDLGPNMLFSYKGSGDGPEIFRYFISELLKTLEELLGGV